MAGSRVLVVDDEPDLRSLLGKYLRRLGHRVETAGSGEEAWLMFQQAPVPFDVFLIDVTLPNLDGQELTRRILDVEPASKVILTSGFRSNPRYLKWPQVTFLQKPFIPGQLAEVMQRIAPL